MHWQIWLAALFVVMALAGCASVAAGPGQAPNAPYQQSDPRDTPDPARRHARLRLGGTGFPGFSQASSQWTRRWRGLDSNF
jgi:hypothetical protein